MADRFNRSGSNHGGIPAFRDDQPAERRGGRRSNDKAYGERREGRPFGERREGRPFGERREGRPFGDRRPESRPFGERREGRPFGERRESRPFGERRPEGRPYGEKREGRSYGDRREGRSYGDRRPESKPYGDRRPEGRPYGERRPEGRPFGDRRFDRRSGGAGFRSAEPQTEAFTENEQSTENIELPNIIMGRNPVKERIKSGRSIDRILVVKEHDGSLGEIIGMAKDAHLVIREIERAKLDEICMPFGHNGKSGNHQGIVAEIPEVEYCSLNDILEYAAVRDEKPFVALLDGIEDPHNLGSIIRSAECAGAHGVVITKRRSASVTAAVVKTSAGAAEHIRICKVVNLTAAIDKLKEAGLWIAGADMGGKSMYETDMKGGLALVIGGEGEGISPLIKSKCDFLVSIPLKGHIESLNASVAAAVIMFEKIHQDIM